ncbi:MAG: hypothetical protein H7315_07920 [Herminiimonas sp.]|nr:hypothetical protein [Herminiimonas sp.]
MHASTNRPSDTWESEVIQAVTAKASPSVTQAVRSGSEVVQTDTHTLILRQVRQLQAHLRGLYEHLAKLGNGPGDIDLRIELQHQIQAVQRELQALQEALVTTENKKITVIQDAPKSRFDSAPGNTEKLVYSTSRQNGAQDATRAGVSIDAMA